MNNQYRYFRSTPQPTSPAMPTKPKHTKRNIGIIVAVVVIAIIALALGMGSATSGPTYVTQSTTVFSGSAAVNPSSYYYITFNVPSNAINVQLSINLEASGGSGNDIRLYVMSYTDFINWQNGHTVSPYYSTGQETAFNTVVNLPNGGGTYVVVFDNTFSIFSSKTVTGTITLTYQVPSS